MTEPMVADAASRSERHPGAAALFEADRKAPYVAETPQSHPRGRILPSLADLAPVTPPAEAAAAPSRGKRDGRGPARESATRPKKGLGGGAAPPGPSAATIDSGVATPSLRSLETPALEARAIGSRALAGSADGAPRKARTPRASAKPKAAPAEAVANPLASLLAARAVAAAPDASPEIASAESAEGRQARHRRIMDRYALGVEPKPGQGWKRRLQKARK